MKSIIICYLLAIPVINPIVNAHENHDHQIYNWSNLKNKTIKPNATFDVKELEDNTKSNTKSHWIKILRK